MLDRSPDGTTPEDQAILNCPICQTLLKSVVENYQTSCGHDFHRKCIATHFKNRCQQNTVGETVSRLMATPIHSATNSVNKHAPDLNPPVTYLENQNQNTRNIESSFSPRSQTPDLANRPDKVVHFLNGWKLKFSGSGMTIDNFIYRVEALTQQTLEGNAKNASVLFKGKANEFYWRYHKTVGDVRWDGLCVALRMKFRQERDDTDIEELIRGRKQKANESFDSFLDGISV